MEGKRFIKLEQLRVFFKKQSSDSDIDWATVGKDIDDLGFIAWVDLIFWIRCYCQQDQQDERQWQRVYYVQIE